MKRGDFTVPIIGGVAFLQRARGCSCKCLTKVAENSFRKRKGAAPFRFLVHLQLATFRIYYASDRDSLFYYLFKMTAKVFESRVIKQAKFSSHFSGRLQA